MMASPSSGPALCRASRLGEQSACLSEMAGTSPAMTEEKFHNAFALSHLNPSPRAMMPRRISVVPPWMVSLGAIMVAKAS